MLTNISENCTVFFFNPYTSKLDIDIFSHTSLPETPARCPTLSSDTNWSWRRPHTLRTQSHRLSPPQTSLISSMSPGRQQLPTWLPGSGSCDSLPSFNNLLDPVTEPRTAVYLMWQIYYKGHFKGYKWVARWRDTEDEVRKGPRHRNFCPCGVRVPASWRMAMFTEQGILHTSRLWIAREAPSWKRDQLLTPSPSRAPPQS